MKKKLLINNSQLIKKAKGIYRYFCALQPYLAEHMQMEMLFEDVEGGIFKRKMREQLFLLNNKKKYDVLWSPSHASGPYWSRKQVVTVHDLIPLHPDSGISSSYKAYFKNSVGLMVRNAAHVVCISAAVADMVQVFYNVRNSKLSVIRNGFDTIPPIDIIACPDVLAGRKYIIFVGTLAIHKNVGRLIEAFMIHKMSSQDDLVLVLVGSFTNSISLGKTDLDFEHLKARDVMFFNSPNDALLVSLYRHSHGVVMPSLIEGFGLPIAEALSYNKPVICSDISVFRELFGGMIRSFFNPYRIDSIQQAINNLSYSEGHLTENENTMYQKVKVWNWQNSADAYVSTFNSIST